MENLRMPFGRFVGEKVVSLPRSYIWWLYNNVDMREPLKTAVSCVLFRKPFPETIDYDAVDDIVKPWEGFQDASESS